MKKNLSIAVCSRSFSNNAYLRNLIKKKYYRVKFNKRDKLSGKKLIKFLKGHDGAIIGLEQIDSKLLNNLPDLKFISKFGVGINNLEIDSLIRRKIKFGWEKGVNKRSVSELTICLILNLLRKIKENSNSRNIINWSQHMGSNLTGMTVGIIGCGNVGKDLVSLLKPFKCKILVNDIKNYEKFYKTNNIMSCSLNNLIKKSDIVSIHTPLNSKTINLINHQNINKFKEKSIIINTARGGIINEKSLLSKLKKNKNFYAACDVFDNEPKINYEFLKLNNFIALPHIGGTTKQSILAMGLSAIKGLEKHISMSRVKDYE